MVAPDESAPDSQRVASTPRGRTAIVIELAGRIDRADIPAMCERVRATLEASAADLVICDVGGLSPADCVTVDALARLQLTVVRVGRRLELRAVSPELWSLLCFAGLSEVLRRSSSVVQPRREAE